MPHVSDIKLIRTDTTLDLSQKAEKVDRSVNKQRQGISARQLKARTTRRSPLACLVDWWRAYGIDLETCKSRETEYRVVIAIPHVSDIKLIRTDTTLDLSQKAEKAICLLQKKAIYYAYDIKNES
ncbi:hypothetical protein Sjap_005331 [Stephania japonica]|uniref:Uncharacterized protein n=1 Tax=Stephania japonica TaxID=461633 RepID=A0AAP0K5D8_9MAGN